MTAPRLVVAVAGTPDVRYHGDGEWFGVCPACSASVAGFSKGEASRLLDEHRCPA